jgi:hypothetical protein
MDKVLMSLSSRIDLGIPKFRKILDGSTETTTQMLDFVDRKSL